MTSGVLSVGLDAGRGDAAAAYVDSIDSIPLDHAVNGLRRAHPEFSAASPFAAWQVIAIYAIAIGAPAVVTLAASGYDAPFAAILTLPFAIIVLLRCAALCHLLFPSRKARQTTASLHDDALPQYSVLIPVYNENAVAPALVHAMSALNYPADKLDIIFITEANDLATRASLLSANLKPHMRVLTVPAGLPQTKPRALNYALQFARGDLVAIFDAEDVPAPDQLRKAAAHFAHAGPDFACVQARLSIYNPEDGFLTRQFTLEYAVLFEAILPALERLGLPILLGGTSNHFRRKALIAAGGWDAFNVTEDADLGVRLARLGFRVGMLDSDTWEEAPRHPRAWMGQRTRWLKGWIQTYLVHMRAPRRLLFDLGAWRFLGVQITLAGMILSALVHPWFYFAALACIISGTPVLAGSGPLWVVCWFNFAAGHAVGIVLGFISAWRSQGRVPLGSAIDLPFYWLAISAASYRAIWDLYQRPFYWEKTPHTARPVAATRHPTLKTNGV